MELDNGVRVALGRREQAARLRRLFSVRGILEAAGVARVDLRYPTGVAVRYREAGR